MNEEDEFTLWVGAWRYYCGRRTYAVGMFCEALRRAWTSIPQRARALIQRELDAEFVRDDELRVGGAKYKALGDDCDRAEWEKVRKLWKVGAGETAVQGDMLLPANARGQATAALSPVACTDELERR